MADIGQIQVQERTVRNTLSNLEQIVVEINGALEIAEDTTREKRVEPITNSNVDEVQDRIDVCIDTLKRILTVVKRI